MGALNSSSLASTSGGRVLAAHRRQHRGGLLAAHHRDPRVGPHPQEPRRIRAPAHRVVARAVGAADDDGQLRHPRARHRGDHLGAVLGDAARLVVAAHHEARDVLQEQQRDHALVAQLDEMRALHGGFAEQHAVVGDDADGVAVDVRETGDQRAAVLGLELGELASVDDAGDDFAHVVGHPGIDGYDVIELGLVGDAVDRRCDLPRQLRARPERGPGGRRGRGPDRAV